MAAVNTGKYKLPLWLKMFAASATLCIGGPALVIYVTPSEEEIFNRYSPELKKKALEERPKRMQEYQEFMDQLKEYSKGDKNIWLMMAEDKKRKQKELYLADKRKTKEAEEKKAQLLAEQMEELRK